MIPWDIPHLVIKHYVDVKLIKRRANSVSSLIKCLNKKYANQIMAIKNKLKRYERFTYLERSGEEGSVNSPQMTAEEIPNLYKLQRLSPYYRFLYGKVQEVMQEDVRTKRSGRL